MLHALMVSDGDSHHAVPLIGGGRARRAAHRLNGAVGLAPVAMGSPLGSRVTAEAVRVTPIEFLRLCATGSLVPPDPRQLTWKLG